MRQNRISLLLVFLFAAILLVPAVHADMIVPKLTYVYFDQGGIPYNGNVNFTVTCYGYGTGYYPLITPTGSYQPQPIYRYSVNYTGYRSPDYHQSYLQYTHIDWCELEGIANNKNFTIKNISLISRRDIVMQRVTRELSGHKNYYYVTPEYISCTNFEKKTADQWTINSLNFSRINSTTRMSTVLQLPGRKLLYGILPRNGVSVNRSDFDMDLERYIGYLETCRVNIDPGCPGWIADGKPLKSFPEYRTLKQNATYMKEHPCDTFLLEADPSLILPFNGTYLLDHPCIDDDGDNVHCDLAGFIEESRFTIPSDIDLDSTGFRTHILIPTAGTSANAHRSPVESLFCSILSRFDMSCDTV
jgi:hypothetical protein